MSESALIGATGFVGSTLLRQRAFAAHYNSRNIDAIQGQAHELLVCAGAPAQKWLANREPEQDRAGLARLMHALAHVAARRFVLISTVDVFAHPVAVDEATPITTPGLHAYGRHRYELEQFVRGRFPDALIVRLPGLVGPGLRKNVIFDLHNANNLAQVDGRAVFQFYPMVNLWADLEAALAQSLTLLHLTAAPIDVATLAHDGFGVSMSNVLPAEPPRYDFRSLHAQNHYQYDRAATLLAVRAYAQSEPRTGNAVATGSTVVEPHEGKVSP